ncbi:MAG TPA: imidazole glycerol phosphate synthase subunit HisH [Planctomycetaceae bacterium]|nr:imidazole glycerol phosphate synthase subunit HisH [Planctomycetaceae bacterium]
MTNSITIVDYGMGNLRSVQKACEKLGATAHIATSPEAIRAASKLILPGVGAFRDAIHELQRLDLVEPLRQHIQADKPFLGICLGLQMLFDVSYEDGEWPGLGVFAGDVVRFPSDLGLKVPHMGWNTLEYAQPQIPLFAHIPPQSSVYFVHSYYVRPKDSSLVAAKTTYGVEFVSAIARGNVYATQFHPEKSQKVGLQLLTNFIGL